MKKHDLYDKFLSDSLTEEEENELLKVLRDKEQSDKFTEYIIETNMMVSAAENVETLEKQKAFSRSDLRTVMMIAAAMISIGVFLFFKSEKSPYEILESSIPAYEAGDKITFSNISLDKGEVALRSSSGDIIKIKGPVDINLEKLNRINVNYGLVLVQLDNETEEFEAQTPHGLVRDLGTAFGLNVLEERTDMHVFDGAVQIELPALKQTLKKGQAISFNKAGKTKGIPFLNDIFSIKNPNIIHMGSRELRPGESMALVLDKAGKSLSARLNLKFDKEEEFQYRVNAYSNEKLIYESEIFDKRSEAQINIPAEGLKNLNIEMKVIEGFVTNGVLNLEKLSLSTEGHRPYEGEVLIPSQSVWNYKFDSKPGKSWMSKNFDTGSWKAGKATLGYGDIDIITKIGSDDLRKTVSRIYLRHEFDITDLEINSLKKMDLKLLADDGAIIFLNGREISRYNLSEGPVSDEIYALKTAIKTSGEMIYNNITVPPNGLLMGKNVICVILVQKKGRSSDMRFDLKMSVF